MNGSAVPRTDQLLSISVVSSANHIATARLAYRDGEAASGSFALSNGSLRHADGTLAGAHLDMASAVRNVVSLADVDLGSALQSASLTPASWPAPCLPACRSLSPISFSSAA